MTRRVLALALVAAAACQPPSPPRFQGAVIGATAVAIDTRGTTVRTGEAAIGDYMADSLRTATTAMGYDVSLALINSGAIRGGAVIVETVPVTVAAKLGRIYPPGPLTDLDVIGWFPFRDQEDLLDATGRQLKGALERGAAQLPPDLRDDAGGPLLQLSGGAYTIDCGGTVQLIDAAAGTVVREGTRVVRLEVGGVVLYDAAAGVDLLDATRVRLVVNDFVADGLDGHVTLAAAAGIVELPYDQLNLQSVLVAAVAAGSPIAPHVDGRITILGDCGQPLSLP